MTTTVTRLVGVYGKEQEQQRFLYECTFRDGLLFTFDNYPAQKST